MFDRGGDASPDTRHPVRVAILYPADPAGVVPGGIDTFIRGILRWSPPDIRVGLVGVSTDPVARPLGRWTEVSCGRGSYPFFPVATLSDPTRRGRVPLSVRFMLGLLRYRPRLEADILEFHRLEPALLYLRDSRPKTAVVHQNMQILRDKDADIRWKYLPALYFALQDLMVPRLSNLFTVREDAAAWYRERYPAHADKVHFMPTWVDPEVFWEPDQATRAQRAAGLRRIFGFPEVARVLISVGRLDTQKDPLLLLRAFAALTADDPTLCLVYVGDGVLRPALKTAIAETGLGDRVVLAGLRPQLEIASLLQGADLFTLSSAYEGMPMCVLEALGSGLPVAATAVGEVPRVVQPGINGALAAERTPEALATAIRAVLRDISALRGAPCTAVAAQFSPAEMLKPAFANWRRLAA
jgi:glycosyltransferase involved in cell wall biosynthesis